MDVAMSVSTSLHEIKEQRPDITAKEIFKSGINIGRDMIGTMSNTLILAYAGGKSGAGYDHLCIFLSDASDTEYVLPCD